VLLLALEASEEWIGIGAPVEVHVVQDATLEEGRGEEIRGCNQGTSGLRCRRIRLPW